MIPDLHDYTIDSFNWHRKQQTMNIAFIHNSLPSITLTLEGVDEFKIKDFTESNIVGDSILQEIEHADELFWSDLFDGVVPIARQKSEITRILDKTEPCKYAFSITGSYGSLWAICREFKSFAA